MLMVDIAFLRYILNEVIVGLVLGIVRLQMYARSRAESGRNRYFSGPYEYISCISSTFKGAKTDSGAKFAEETIARAYRRPK